MESLKIMEHVKYRSTRGPNYTQFLPVILLFSFLYFLFKVRAGSKWGYKLQIGDTGSQNVEVYREAKIHGIVHGSQPDQEELSNQCPRPGSMVNTQSHVQPRVPCKRLEWARPWQN